MCCIIILFVYSLNFFFFLKKNSNINFTLEQMPLGFDTNDKIINETAKILRLLYIQDLRTLQTKINETIVSIQSLVADPRTDSKLGKIGW